MSIYKIDAAHSEIGFRIKHLMISYSTGKFTQFDATMESDKEDFSDAKVHFEAEINSITTGNEQRDEHLKSDDFFNASEYPKLTFDSTSLEQLNDEEYKLTGNLTIRDVTKPVTLDVVYNGTVTDPWGQVKAGFEINGKINRKEFGLKWSAVTEAGGLVLGDDVKLHLNIEMHKQA